MDQGGDLDVENLLFDEDELRQDGIDHDMLQDAVAVPDAPPVTSGTGTVYRLANLSACGALQRVAWSRQGHIAWISEDGVSVSVKCQRVNIKTKQWEISKAERLDAVFEDAISVVFSPSGADLLVLDRRGRAHIFYMSPICLTRLQYIRDGVLDPGSELDQPIGVFWLHQDRTDKPKQIVSEAQKVNGRWRHNTMRVKPLQPTWLRAVLIVNRGGTVSITYQRPDQQYRKASYALPVPAGSTFTHATISPNPETKVLVALYSTVGSLSVFSCELIFPVDLKRNTSSETLPTFNIHVVDQFVPNLPPAVDSPDDPNSHTAFPWVLTHLEFVPTLDTIPTTEADVTPKDPPTLYALFSSYNPSLNAQNPAFFINSIVKRWTVDRAEFRLHSRFDDIPGNTKVTPSPLPKLAVKTLPDAALPQVATNFQYLDLSTSIAISTREGRTERYTAGNMSPRIVESSPTQISCPAQTHINFGNIYPALTEYVSPNGLAITSIDEENNVRVNTAVYDRQDLSEENMGKPRKLNSQDTIDDAVSANFVLAFARSCWANAISDDVIASVRGAIEPSSYDIIVKHLYSSQFRPTDFISERAKGNGMDKVAQQPLVSKILSFQLALYNVRPGELPQTWPITRMWAWISINVRYITTMTYLFHQNVAPPKGPDGQPLPAPPLVPTYIDMICNNVRWCFGLLGFILQSILEIGDRKSTPSMFRSPDFDTLLGDASGDGTQGLVALLLNSNWSRVFLATMIRLLKALYGRNHANQTNAAPPPSIGSDTPLGKVLATIHHCSAKHGFTLSMAEMVLHSKWYADTPKDKDNMAGEDPNVIMERQIEMMATGVVPDVYQGTLRNVLDNCMNGPDGLCERGDVNRLKLLDELPSRGYLLLNMDDIAFEGCRPVLRVSAASSAINGDGGDSAKGADRPVRQLWDVHKKAPLFAMNGNQMVRDTMKQVVRRCVRCGSVNDDVEGMERVWPRSMQQFMARCVCDGHWILEEFGEGLR